METRLLFKALSQGSRRMIMCGRIEACGFGSQWIEIEHLLISYIGLDTIYADSEEDVVFQRFLSEGHTPIEVLKKLKSEIPRAQAIPVSTDLPLAVTSKEVLAIMFTEHSTLENEMCPEYLLLGILEHTDSLAKKVLLEVGVSVDSVREYIRNTVIS